MQKKTADNLLNLVQTSYSQIAADFNETRKKKIWPELKNLADGIDDSLKHRTVLDVGCGNGRLAELFRGRNISYLGLDSCRPLLALAKNNYPETAFAEADILRLSQIKAHGFDYVFCIAVLHHLPGDTLRLEALKQLKSKLQPNGRLILTVWNLWGSKYRSLIFKYWLLKLLGKNDFDFGDIVFDWQGSQGTAPVRRYYHAFTKRALLKLMRQADLTVEQFYHDRYNYYLVLKK